ncbi:MAG: ABC transporter permease [Clostridiales bacterium]
MLEALNNIVPLAICFTTPLLIIALGGLVSERSGVVNIGLEGILGFGAFTSAYVLNVVLNDFSFISLCIALVSGAIAGGFFSLIHAFASITMKANQVISGTALNILSPALAIYLSRIFAGSANIGIKQGFLKTNVPLLSKIPFLGVLFRDAYITSLLVLIIVIITWFILYRRPLGLRLRSCGENPHAADSAGINVNRMRYLGVFVSGTFAGLGGAIIITTYAGEFSINIYNGLGFLALAALIFGKWKPFGVLVAALFFGITKTSAEISTMNNLLKEMPQIIFTTFPYVATLIALVVFSKNSVSPKAAGEPFEAGKR